MNQELETQLVKACINNKTQRTTTLGVSEYKADIDRYRNGDRLNKELDKIF